MEAITKQEILANLYSLRAGMSVVSEYSDVVREYDERIAQYDVERKKKRLEIPQMRGKAKKEIEWRENQIVNVNKRIAAQMKASNDIHRKNKGSFVGIFFGWVVFALLIIVALCAVVVGVVALSSTAWFPIKSISDFAQGNKVWTMILCVGTVIACVPMCFHVFSEIDIAKTIIIDEQAKIRKILDEIEKLQQEITACRSGIEMWRKKAPADDAETAVENKLLEEKTDYQRKTIPLYNDAISIAKAMITTLELNLVLDPRDWENLDLVIFYMETGRADSIKEALQLVDKEKQTAAIINAVEKASLEIQGTIRTSVVQLGHLMTTCFGQLSMQMTRCFQEQNKLLRQQSSQLEGMSLTLQQTNEHLSEICSQEKIQNAFLSKISYSSLSLARDVQSMRFSEHITLSHVPLTLS